MEEMEIQSQDGLRPGENLEGKESESLDDATFEPGSLVEQTGDFQQSEAIQTNLSEVINNAVNQTTEQSGTSGVKGPGAEGVAVTPINLPREADVATGDVHGGGGDGVAITPINLPGGADVAIGGVHGGGGDGVAITPINLPGGANVANGEIHGPGGDGVASPNIPGGANVATSGVKGPGGDGVAEGVRVPGGGDPATLHGSAPVTTVESSMKGTTGTLPIPVPEPAGLDGKGGDISDSLGKGPGGRTEAPLPGTAGETGITAEDDWEAPVA